MKKIELNNRLARSCQSKVNSLVTSLKIILCLIALSPFNPTNAQTFEEDVTPIAVGERIPAAFWEKKHLFFINGDTIRKNLSEYKGKLLILDFWSTSCGTCISTFPIINKFIKNYKEKMNVVLVNEIASRDNFEKISNFYKRNKEEHFKGSDFITIILDDKLGRNFVHRGYPHYVWINSNGYLNIQTFRNLLDPLSIAPFINIEK